MKDGCGTQFFINHIKTVTQNNIQVHLVIISYSNVNEQKTRTPKANSLTNDSMKDRIEIAMNGHLENCICEKCHEAREMLKALRAM